MTPTTAAATTYDAMSIAQNAEFISSAKKPSQYG
jgi:hypothetical protein